MKKLTATENKTDTKKKTTSAKTSVSKTTTAKSTDKATRITKAKKLLTEAQVDESEDISPEEIAFDADSATGRERALVAARAALDKKAEQLKILDLTGKSSFTDYFLICNGNSDKQVQAIADSIKKAMTINGVQLISTEGYAQGRWVLLDFGGVIVHVFLDALRSYYDLENLWANAPNVRIPAEFYGSQGQSVN